MKFWTADWLTDGALRMVGLAAKGLWIDLLCFMQRDGEPYGHLRLNGRPLGAQQIARMVGSTPEEVARLIAELEAAGAFDRDSDGAIFSRRMVRDEALSRARAEAGAHGAAATNARLRLVEDGLPRQNSGKRSGKRPTKGSASPAYARAPARRRQRQEAEVEVEKNPTLTLPGGEGTTPAPAPRPKPSEAWKTVLEEPDFLRLRNSPEWVKAWEEWLAHAGEPGTKAKVPRTTRARAIFRDALEHGPALHAEAIRASIRNDWQGINVEWLRGRGRAAGSSGDWIDQAIEKTGLED